MPVAFVLSIGAAEAAAQDAHYWTNQYGTTGNLLGGAVVGSVVDLSAVFYNPGAVGLIQDPEGVKLLDRFLNGRGFLGRKESGELRACAALALGKMNTPEATAALEKATDEQDPVVRSAVSRALRGEG